GSTLSDLAAGGRMMATPAEVANDMAAHATYWEKRDKKIAAACRDAARLMQTMLSGQYPDGRTFSGVYGRLLRLEHHSERYQAYPNFGRARQALALLYNGRRK
ncbi:MAG: hypothetical protein AAF968_20080, partial [Pseudomonadota bacterium]